MAALVWEAAGGQARGFMGGRGMGYLDTLLLWPAHVLILFPIFLPKGLVMELKKSE